MSTQTSYTALFDATGSTRIDSIEIPLIQRDYAQGRTDAETGKIRAAFVDVLHRALADEKPVSLDFVYGDVQDGRFRPLDGQQRLSTLFLLHWYVASRAGVDLAAQRWRSFSYATRTSARRFCERLGTAALPADLPGRASDWIADQPWFLAVWKHDPTVQAMLVMIDAIAERFHDDDPLLLWERLTDGRSVTFHRLAIDDMGQPDRVYITMNSRGKPLTPFENFKARFEGALKGSPLAKDFADKVDREWSDVLWSFRGDDDLIDDEFMRYLHFATEICEWRRGDVVDGDAEERAIATFTGTTDDARNDLAFLFEAFDTWVGEAVDDWFASRFTTQPSDDDDRLLLFDDSANLFESCLRLYGAYSGKRRRFDFGQTLVLYAVLLHRKVERPDFARRVRILRNLIEASVNEVRLDNMPKLIRDVERIVLDDDLAGALRDASFAKHQRDHEVDKLALLEAVPELAAHTFRLEDHVLLRGALNAFDIDGALPTRVETFERLMADPGTWLALTGALCATGPYQRETWHTVFQFGSPSVSSWWRELLTGQSRDALATTRQVLQTVLDVVAGDNADPRAPLVALQDAFLRQREAERHLDWRYYLVKYDAMREGTSGIYINATSGMGYEVVMLDKRQLNSNYRDPFLYAMVRDHPSAHGIQDAANGPRYTGYVSTERWLVFKASGLRLRNAERGLRIDLPPTFSNDEREALARIADLDADGFLPLAQAEHEGRVIDAEDRVALGRAFIGRAVAAGL